MKKSLFFQLFIIASFYTIQGQLTKGLKTNSNSSANPSVTLTSSQNTFSENQSAEVTASIGQESTNDIVIPLNITGTATGDKDYSVSFPSKGEESLLKQLPNSILNFDQLANGKIIALKDYGSVSIYDLTNNSSSDFYLSQSGHLIKAKENSIYISDWNRIAQLDLSQNPPVQTNVVPFLNNYAIEAYIKGFDVVNNKIFYSKVIWNTGAFQILSKELTSQSSEVILYESNQDISRIAVSPTEEIYVLYNNQIGKIQNNKLINIYSGYTDNINISDIKYYNGKLYLFYNKNIKNYVASLNTEQVKLGKIDYILGNNVSNINDFIIDLNGNLILNNSLPNSSYGLYQYQLSPQIKIPAGSTTGKITFSGIDDEADEPDETIVLTPGTITNATVSSITPIALTIIDNDESPTVSFALSADKIVENSTTTVTLTATPSVVSGKEITIPFTLEGTAKENDEYTVFSNQIVIPANATNGSVTVSTSGKDDALVEIMETIIFKFGTLTNATTTTPTVTLNLDSDDNPTLTGISASKQSFAEHESTEITATISEASSRDVIIPIGISGTAILDSDYTASFASKGEELKIATTPNNSSSFVRLADGRYVFLNSNNSLYIYNPSTKASNVFSLTNYYDRIEVVNNIVYLKSWSPGKIDKIDFSQNTLTIENVVDAGSGFGLDRDIQVVGNKIYYVKISFLTNIRKIYSKTGNSAEVERYQTADYFENFVVDQNDTIYLSDYNSVYKVLPGNEKQYALNTGGQIIDLGYYNSNIYAKVQTGNAFKVNRLDFTKSVLVDLPYKPSNTDNILDFCVDSKENLILLKSLPNSNTENVVYQYQLSPQIKIPAGSTTGKITFSGIDDEADEPDETIVLTPGTITNATVSSTTPISFTINDNDEAPTVTFAFSADKIVENSTTTVTLTATPSVVSGKEITIPFTLEGTAKENDEYTVFSNQIVIPANATNGSVTVSTSGKDDALVEIMETIIFKFGTLTNATTTTPTVTLNLDSDDNPTLTGISASKQSFAEHESTEVTATISEASSRDVIIPIGVSGTATLDTDYTTSFASKGEESEVAKISSGYNNRFVQLEDGRYVFANSNALIIYNPVTQAQTSISLQNYVGKMKAIGNVVYYNYMSKVFKIDFNQSNLTETEILNLTNQNSYIPDFDVVGNTVYYIENNYSTPNRKIYSKTGTTAPSFVYETTSNPNYLSVDSKGILYLSDSWNLQKIDTKNANTVGYISNSNYSISNLKLFNDQLYISGSENGNGNVWKIKKLNSGNNTLENLDFVNTNTNSNTSISDFIISKEGNLQVLRSQNSQTVIYNYQSSPQIKIPAGSTSGKLTIKGVEDDLNFEGQETDETIVFNFSNPINSLLSQGVPSSTELKILNNKVSLTATNSPFMGVEKGAVSWGDYDRDGDQDVAIMGTGISGAVTKLYENKNGTFVDTNQNFTRLYLGDIKWVDINKDGWIDLAVAGFDGKAPVTKIYINEKGASFSSTIDYGLPQLYSSKMAWGDLDNDGDIDLAITGIDADDKYKFYIYYRDDAQNKFTLEPKSSNYQGVINGDIRIVDIDLDGDNDIVYNGESSNNNSINSMGNIVGYTIYNTYIKNSSNNSPNYNYNNGTLSLRGAAIEVAKLKATQNTLTILASGIDYTGATQFYTSDSSLLYSGPIGAVETSFPKLANGDISVADFNNDGLNDILFTGEDASKVPQTKLYYQTPSGAFKLSPIVLEGLRNSTANWVDYDMDGDLDLFITGIAETGGEKTLLYKSEILNKPNAAPQKITGLVAEDLGNGKIKFKWEMPQDDYSPNLGYVIRLGTTPEGTELSNTESNLETGVRLITKQAPIYTNFYEMQLDPGKYYWTVQAVDTGLKGGAFSEEKTFTLTYDWKILNQGGIIDRKVDGIANPVIKLADIDNDKDQDLIYANSNGVGSQLLQFDGKRMVSVQDNYNPNQINYYNNINSADVGDIDGDGKPDIVINYFSQSNILALSNSSNGFTKIGAGLYNVKTRIIDINNDGKLDVVAMGNSTNTAAGVPKLWIYEYDKTTTPPSFKKTDVSSSIASLSESSFDFGDIDKDQDIDLVITGYSAIDGLKSIIYENKTVLGGDFTLTPTEYKIGATKEGTTDLIDFDGDGDLDVVLTGYSGVNGDVFEVYLNKLNEGIKEWPRFSSGLTPIRSSKIDLGDFNGDGYADLLYSGISGGGTGQITKLSEYNKSTQSYQDSTFDVSEFSTAEVEFGDIDGDDDLDFVIVGTNKNWNSNTNASVDRYIFRTYLNVRNDSAKVLALNSGKQQSKQSASVAKYNLNEAPAVPNIPNNATKLLSNVQTKTGTYPIELNWEASTDDHTPSPGLTYAIKIGTTPGGEEIMSANANADGTRKVSEKGNVEHNTKWRVSLPVGNYYWSVQAIDASYSGSEFSAPQKIQVTSTGVVINNSPVANPDKITVVEGEAATELDTKAKSVLSNDTDAENNPLKAILVSNVKNGTLTFNTDGTFRYVHNGTPTTTDSFTYKANDGNTDSNIVTVSISIVPFSIAHNNFSIESKSETCSGKNNGEISITATQSFSYVGKINGTNYNFTNNKLTVSNLAPGTYSVCITIPGKTFEQCYNVTIGKGGSLTGKIAAKAATVSVNIEEGTAPYRVFVNGIEKLLTSSTDFNVEAKQGDLVEVKTAVACEGILSKMITEPVLFGSATAYPNPTKGEVYVSVPPSNKEVEVEVYSLEGSLMSKQKLSVTGGQAKLDLTMLKDGMYMARVLLAEPVNIKIIKKQ